MNQVRIIEPQTEENNTIEVSGWEAEQLLRKYGQTQNFHRVTKEEPINNDLTFDQMVALQDEKIRNEERINNQNIMGPKPISFNGQNGYDSEVRYGADSDTGFGFKIEITTDMNLPKY